MAGLLVWLTAAEWKIYDPILAMALGGMTWSAYSYIRLNSLHEDHVKARYGLYKNVYRLILISIFPLSISVLAIMLPSWWWILLLLLPPAIIVLLYPVVLGVISFRQIPRIKSLMIALTWVWLSVTIPAIVHVKPWDMNLVSLHIQRFLLISLWLLPFDIRDMKFDPESMQTLPQQMGLAQIKRWSGWVGFGLQISVLLSAWLGWLPVSLGIAWVVGLEYLHQLTIRSKPNDDVFITGFWVESLPLIVFTTYFFARIYI